MSSDPKVEQDRVLYWENRWKAAQTDFHMSQLNPTIAACKDAWLGQEKQSILFPLCGKTLDMTILHDEGHTIVGVEGVYQAMEELAVDHQTELHTAPAHEGFQYCKFSAFPNLSIYQGDLFLWPTTASPVRVTRVFDRGSLVAIQPHLRDQYITIIDAMLESGGSILFSVYSYDQEEMNGPPFSMDYATLVSLFDTLKASTGSQYDVQVLKEGPFVDARYFRRDGQPLDIINHAFLATKR